MNAISLAAGVLPDATPQTCARAAATAGYDATGVWIDLAEWTDSTTAEMRAILRDGGIPALDVEVIWLQPGPLDPNHLRVLDIGLELGAANALVVSSDADDGGTAEKLSALCDHAGGGIRVALEFGLFTAVHSIAQASAILDQVDHPAAALLIDPLHLARSGGTPDDVAKVPRSRLPYAQFCDAGALTYDVADRPAVIVEAVDGRLLPGDGVLPLAALLDSVPPALPLSVELRSKTLRDTYPDPVERAKVVLSATQRFISGR
jgi:sugar phosphate isomerase/epimerase